MANNPIDHLVSRDDRVIYIWFVLTRWKLSFRIISEIPFVLFLSASIRSISHGTWTKCSSWLTLDFLFLSRARVRSRDIESCPNDAETENETELLIGMRIKPIQNTETTTREFFLAFLPYALLLIILSFSLSHSLACSMYKNKKQMPRECY